MNTTHDLMKKRIKHLKIDIKDLEILLKTINEHYNAVENKWCCALC